MKKLISLLVAAVFAVSSGMVLAQASGGAKPAEKKDEMKKGDGKDAKKTKKSDKKAKKDDKKKDDTKK